MDWLNESGDWEQVTITYLDIEIGDSGLIKRMNKTDVWIIKIPIWMVSRVSDFLNNPDFFLEYTNSIWIDWIIAKKAILYVTPSELIDIDRLNINSVYVTVELINSQKFFWEVNLWWKYNVKQLFETKPFIPLLQRDISRILILNKDNIKKIEIQRI